MDMLENASIELDERAEVANVTDQAMVVNPQNNSNTAPENPTMTLFAKHFNTTFDKEKDGNCWFAQLKISDAGTEQTYLVVINDDSNDNDYPVKIYPIIPSLKELIGYEGNPDELLRSVFSIENDATHSNEFILLTPRLKRVFTVYKQNGYFSEEAVSEIVQEVADWTSRTSALRKAFSAKKKQNTSKRKPFSYTNAECEKCKQVVISERAYISMLAEAIARDPLETGGVLFGHYDENGTWYIVEATDPGLETYHSTVHNEMDDLYYNHLYPVLSRIYKRDLCLVGLWHRHPGSYDRFSADDNATNLAFAKAIGNGTLSFLMNIDPNERLTCYYLDETGTGEYHKLPVYIGDKYFKRTDYLELNTPRHLWKEQKRLNEEIWAERNGG